MKELVMLAIGAVFGALATPLVNWIISIIKSTETVKFVTEKSEVIFSKHNRAVIYDILSILFYVAVLINFSLDKSTPTKLDILIAIGAVFACLVMFFSLLIDISKAANANKKF